MITCIGQASPLVRDMKWRFSQGRMRMMDRLEKGMDGNVMILAPSRSREERVGQGKFVWKARYGSAMRSARTILDSVILMFVRP